MTRRDSIDPKEFDLKVQAVFVDGCTSAEERLAIAVAWCKGDYESYVRLGLDRGLLPIALIVGALIDIEHPLLVVNQLLVPRSLAGCAALVLRCEFNKTPVHIPVVERAVDGLGTSCGQVRFVHNNGLALVMAG